MLNLTPASDGAISFFFKPRRKSIFGFPVENLWSFTENTKNTCKLKTAEKKLLQEKS